MEDLTGRIKQAHRAARIIAAVFFVSIVMLVPIAVMLAVSQAGASRPDGLPREGVMLLCVIAAVLIAGGPPMAAKLRAPLAPGATSQQRIALIGRYTSSMIITFVLIESAAVIGFVISALTGDLTWVLALSALAVSVLFARWPRRSTLESTFPEIQRRTA